MSILFYDAPTYPNSIFDELLEIPHLEKDISTRAYSNLIQTLPGNASSGLRYVLRSSAIGLPGSLGDRAMFHWVPIEQFTLPILEMVKNQTLVSRVFRLIGAPLTTAPSIMASCCRNQADF
jgi:hypothetical protein